MLKTLEDKKREILQYAERFLCNLTERCIQECGKNISAIEFPVFKKFISYRTRREIEFNRICLEQAEILYQTETELTEEDIKDILEESKSIDKKLLRDIRLLPLRLSFNYQKISPLRRERIIKQVMLFKRMLHIENPLDYPDMVRKAFQKKEFISINNDIVELYAEEAFIINSSLKSILKIDTEALSHRIYCSMIDVGFALNREVAEEIFGK